MSIFFCREHGAEQPCEACRADLLRAEYEGLPPETVVPSDYFDQLLKDTHEDIKGFLAVHKEVEDAPREVCPDCQQEISLHKFWPVHRCPPTP